MKSSQAQFCACAALVAAAVLVSFPVKAQNAATPSAARAPATNSPSRESIERKLTNALAQVNAAQVEALLPELEQLWKTDPTVYAQVMIRSADGFKELTASTDLKVREAAKRFLLSTLNIFTQLRIDIIDHFDKPDYHVNLLLHSHRLRFRSVGALLNDTRDQPLQLGLAEYAGSIRKSIVPLTTFNTNSTFEAFMKPRATGNDDLALARFMLEHSADRPEPKAAYDYWAQIGDAAEFVPSVPTRRLNTRVRTFQMILLDMNKQVIEGMFISIWSRLPSQTPEDLAFKEKIATTAKLVPEERRKIGLKN